MPSSIDPASDVPGTATLAVLRASRRHGDAVAVTGAAAGAAVHGSAVPGGLTYFRLVHTAQSAAVGLYRRGTRPGDVAGILLPPGASYVLALVSLLTAGVAVVPLDVDGDPVAAADLLTEHDARLLVTAPLLARTAMEITERSRVRQIVSFGDLPGATSYAELSDDGGPPEITPAAAALIAPGLVLSQGELASLLRGSGAESLKPGPARDAVRTLHDLVAGATLEPAETPATP